NKGESLVPDKLLPYAMTSRGNAHNITGLSYLEAAYKAGNFPLAEKIKASLKKDMEQQKRYYEYIRTNREEFANAFFSRNGNGEAERNEYFLKLLGDIEQKYDPNAKKPTTVENPKTVNTVAPGDTSKKDSTPKPKR